MCTTQHITNMGDLATVIHYSLSPEGIFTHVSAGSHAIGFDPDEMVGHHFSEFIHPDDLEQISRASLVQAYGKQTLIDSNLRKVVDERRTGRRVTTALPARLLARQDISQTYLNVTISAAGLYSHSGSQHIFQGTCGTIRVPARETRLTRPYTVPPDPIHLNTAPTILHTGGLILAANRRALALLEIDNEEDVVGLNIHQFLPEYEENAEENLSAPAMTHHITQLLYSARDSKQRVHLTEIGTRRMGFEARKLVLAPVTEQDRMKRIPARVLRHLASLRDTVNQHAIVAITDRAGRITYVNDKFCQISGYTRHELIGQNHRILKSGYHSAFFFTEMWRTICAGETWNGIVCNRSKSGDLYWVNTTIMPVLDERNQPIQFISIRTEITEQKKTEALLREAIDNANRANHAKTVFLGNMSHEIRNPINGIMGLSTLALENDPDEATARYLKLIRSTGQSVLELLNNLLEQSRIDEGRFQKEEQEFHLREEIDSLIQSFVALAEQKKNHFIAEISDTIPDTFIGDIQRIRQILVNLLSNSVKFTREGEIHILVSGAHDTTNAQICNLTICVSDTGIGIPPDQLENLFERYNDASRSTSANYGGTGLGMSLVRQFTELLDGKVTVYSPAPRYNRGTEFCVTLPLKRGDTPLDNNAKAPAQKIASLRLNQTPKKILVVDDDEINRFYLKKIVQNLGHETHTAENGHAALELIRKTPCDVILMDIRMPGIDGIEATRILRDEISRTIPVIGISANTSDDDIDSCLSAGMNQFIGKPFSPVQIAEALNLYKPAKSEQKQL